jgi:hypothetical protein
MKARRTPRRPRWRSRAQGTGVAVVLAATGALAALPATATAATVSCGTVIKQSTTLTADLGPCPGEGIVIGANGVTLDLNGHTITGDPQARAQAAALGNQPDSAGVDFRNVSGSSVIDGTVRDFDAGVAINGGSGDTVNGIVAEDNVNYRVLYGVNSQPLPNTPTCDYGDGIITDNSSNDRIIHNVALRNGPFDGIALVDFSTHDTVSGNSVADNDVANTVQGDPTGSASTVCGTGPGGGAMMTGRAVQDIGIRVEGPGAQDNTVSGNLVSGSALVGIAVLPTVCQMPNGMPAPSNDGNTITGNTVTDTGTGQVQDSSVADGIALLENGPPGVVCVSSDETITGNTSNGNRQDGIILGGRASHNNTVEDNVTDGNGRDGIRVTGPEQTGSGQTVAGSNHDYLAGNRGFGNGEYDGADFNPGCATNQWSGNRFDTVNQSCVATAAPPAKASKHHAKKRTKKRKTNKKKRHGNRHHHGHPRRR